ncbi:MFS transporter [Anaerobacillus arseniciselenatis]|uniref:MFS transporter n=1 Tax=Anaerobacillus arseniciselenatis TaxID=85682 RepID=A0A1S2LRT9_9BACI|nr:MFS transporter [Anaerobacillus arseniciselenatis]OIJ15228.1 MFS transporter [Anaerobacillus arseniciselenatis]
MAGAKQKRARTFNLPVIFGVTLMTVLGVSSVSPAFPEIMSALNITETQVGLLITVFTVPGVILTPLMGVLADRFGRKKVLIPSLILFGFAGGMVGFSQNFSTLLLLRFFQGIGAAGLGSLNVTIIGDLYDGNERTKVMGHNASVLSIGTAVYPLIGGSLAAVSWNFPFLLPWLAIPLGFAVMIFLKVPELENKQHFKQYLRNAWTGITDQKVIGIFLAGVIVFIILYGSYLTYFSILLGKVYQASSFIIGLLMFSMSITTAVVASQLGRLNKRYRKHSLLKIGFCGYAISMVMIPFVNEISLFLIPIFIFGAAHGLTMPSLQTLLAEQAPMKFRGIYMSLNGAMLRIGQTTGPLMIGLIYMIGGFNGAFFGGSIIAVVGLLVVHFMVACFDATGRL